MAGNCVCSTRGQICVFFFHCWSFGETVYNTVWCCNAFQFPGILDWICLPCTVMFLKLRHVSAFYCAVLLLYVCYRLLCSLLSHCCNGCLLCSLQEVAPTEAEAGVFLSPICWHAAFIWEWNYSKYTVQYYKALVGFWNWALIWEWCDQNRVVPRRTQVGCSICVKWLQTYLQRLRKMVLWKVYWESRLRPYRNVVLHFLVGR